jgi:hypothetical protein
MNTELAKMIIGLAFGGDSLEHERNVGQNIVVLDRGYVYVGDVTYRGEEIYIANARNIRIWGTTEGLGELRNGPLPSTKLDVVGEVVAPVRELLHRIPCKGF